LRQNNKWFRWRLKTVLMTQHHKSFAEAQALIDNLDDEMFDEVMTKAVVHYEKTTGKKVEKIGDGTIFQKILEFLQSETGQALIQIFIQIILGLL